MLSICVLICAITMFVIPVIFMYANDNDTAMYLIAGIVAIDTIGLFLMAWFAL